MSTQPCNITISKTYADNPYMNISINDRDGNLWEATMSMEAFAHCLMGLSDSEASLRKRQVVNRNDLNPIGDS